MKPKIYILFLFILTTSSLNAQSGWIQTASISNVELGRTLFLNQNTGFSVGKENSRWVIYKTTNGGYNWIRTIAPQTTIFGIGSVFFINNQTGFCAAQNLIKKTTNQGDTWDDNSLNGYNGYDIVFSNELTGYISSSSGIILKTTNGAQSWTPYTTGFTETITLLRIFPDNSQTLIGVAGKRIIKSTNAGLNWVQVFNYTSTSIVTDLSLIDNNIIYVTGYGSPLSMYKSTDAGLNWTNISNNQVQTYSYSRGQFINKDTGFFASKYIHKTIDGGLTWHVLESAPSARIYNNIYILNDTFAVISCTDQSIYNAVFLKTFTAGEGLKIPHISSCVFYYNTFNLLLFNGNSNAELGTVIQRRPLDDTTWSIIDTVQPNTTATIDSAFSPNFIYRMYNYYFFGNSNFSNEIIPSLTGITSSNTAPGKYKLHPNYPNPFNPSTNISFDIPERSDVSLIIYDGMGKLVTELTNTALITGKYTYTWDATGIASGVYYARFTARGISGSSFSDSKKLLLIK